MIQRVKISTFVPLDAANTVRDALGKAGAGVIGEYSYCSFSVAGKGRFLPSNEANPHIGHQGVQEVVDEERIEMVCSRVDAHKIISVLKNVHPYEEVAFDIVPLLNEEDL